MQWLQSADLDPNDPDNASLMELRRLLDSTQVHLDQEPRFRLRGRDASYMAPPRRGARDRQLRCKTRWADSGPCSPSRRRPAGGAGGGGGGREAARPQGRGDGGQQLASALRIWQRRLGDQLDLQRGLQAELASAPPPPCAPEPPHLVLTPNLSPPPQAATARGSAPQVLPGAAGCGPRGLSYSQGSLSPAQSGLDALMAASCMRGTEACCQQTGGNHPTAA